MYNRGKLSKELLLSKVLSCDLDNFDGQARDTLLHYFSFCIRKKIDPDFEAIRASHKMYEEDVDRLEFAFGMMRDLILLREGQL